MAGDFIPSGVELVARGLGQFLSDLKTADNAIAKVGSGVSVSATPFIELGNSILDVGAKAAQVAAGGVAILGAALVAVAAKGTEAFIDLEQGMADIQAISGDTAEVVAPLKDLIGELALDPKLKVTTNEAEQAMYALTKQGLEVTEILDGAGKSTIELANATGGPFKQSAEISAQAMRIWGLEASNMGMIADGIAGVLTNSKFEFNDYALALAQGGAVTANFGVSLQDFNTVIAGSASAFSSGSDAGTSFKTMMLRLAAPTKEMQTAMQQYGISLFDGNGQMRDMKDIVADLNQALYGTVTVTSTVGGATKEQANAAKDASEAIGDLTRDVALQEQQYQLALDVYNEHLKYYDASEPQMRREALALQDKANSLQDAKEKVADYQGALDAVVGLEERQIMTTKQLTEAERAKLAETLGGADASRLLLEISKLTGEEFEALSGKVNASGQAMNAAAIRMDTTRGALDILHGVIEAVQIQIGEKFTPLVKGAAQAMTQWVSDNSAGIITFFADIATGIENVIAGLMKIGGAFGQFGVRGAAVSLLGQLGFDQESVAQVTSVIDTITSEIDRIKLVFQQFGASGVAFSIGGLLGLDSDSMIAIKETIDSIIETVTNFADQVKIILSGMGFEELKGALLGVGAVLATGVFAAVVAGLLSLLTPINLIIAGAALLGAAWAGNWGGIQEITASVIGYIIDQASDLKEELTPAFNSIKDSLGRLGEAFGSAGVTSDSMMETLKSLGNFIVGTVIPGIIQLAGILSDSLATRISGVVDWMIKGHDAFVLVSNYITSTVIPAATDLGTTIKDILNTAIEYMANLWSTKVKPALLAVNNAITPLADLLESIGNVSIAITNKALEALAGWAETTVDNLKFMGDYISKTFNPVMTKISKLLEEKLNPVMKKIGTFLTDILAPGFASTGGTVKEDVLPVLSALAEDVLPILEEGINIVNEAIQDMIGFFNAMANAVNEFDVPEILKPGSPPPLAYAMWDIANAAGDADKAVSGLAASVSSDKFELAGRSIMQRIASGAALDGGSLRQAIEAQLGFSAKMFKGRGGEALEDEERAQAKQSLFDTYRSLYDDLLSGKAGREDFLSVFSSGLKGFDATEFKQAMGIVGTHVDDFISTIRQQFGELTFEMKAQALSVASNLSSIAGAFAGKLNDQLETFNKFKEGAAKLDESNKILGVTYTEQTNKLSILKEEYDKLTTGQGANQIAIEKHTEALAFGERQMAIYNEELASLTPDTLAWDKKKLAIDKLTESMDMQRQELEKLQSQTDIDALSIEKKILAIEELTASMADNQAAIEKNKQALVAYRKELETKAFAGFNAFATGTEQLESDLAMMELLSDFIKSGQSQLRIVGEELGGIFAGTGRTADIFHTQISAQQELARLQQEQLDRERLITEQKEAQEKLGFLQMQQDLFEQARQLGITDVFKGMKFGLEASAQDILDATNALINAMILQIDQGFDLGSPSHLMYDKFSDVVAGARMALEDGKAIMGKAMGAMLAPMYDMSSLTPGMSSVSNVTNYNFPMTVNTAASAPAVVRQYEIKRSMYAAD